MNARGAPPRPRRRRAGGVARRLSPPFWPVFRQPSPGIAAFATCPSTALFQWGPAPGRSVVRCAKTATHDHGHGFPCPAPGRARHPRLQARQTETANTARPTHFCVFPPAPCDFALLPAAVLAARRRNCVHRSVLCMLLWVCSQISVGKLSPGGNEVVLFYALTKCNGTDHNPNYGFIIE